MKRPDAAILSALPLAAVLAWAGVAKAFDAATFATAIVNFRLIGPQAAWLAAHYLPWLEISVAAGLLLPAWRRPAGALALGLLAAFSAALIAADVRGIDVACGCFGGGETATAYGWLYLRNGLLMLLAATAVVRPGLRRPA